MLQPITAKWKEIGYALNVKPQALDDIGNNSECVKEGPEGFMRATLNAVETLTVRALANALRSSSVQEEDIACALDEYG